MWPGARLPGRPHAVSQPLAAAYHHFLLFSTVSFCPRRSCPCLRSRLWVLQPEPQLGRVLQAGYVPRRSKTPLASPLLQSPANSRCLQVAIRQDQRRWLCGQPAHSQSLEMGREWSWEQNQTPRHPSGLSPQLCVFIVFVSSFFSWSKDSGFPLYSVKPPQQQGWPGTPLLLPCICRGVKL